MRVICIYVSAYIIMHTISPVLVSHNLYSVYGLPPYTLLYTAAILGALLLLISNMAVKRWHIQICIIANCMALALISVPTALSVGLGMTLSGLTSPLLIKGSFELSEEIKYPIGNVFGFSSLCLEGMAFLCGVMAAKYGSSTAIAGLILVLLAILISSTSKLKYQLPTLPAKPVEISKQSILSIMPAIAANAAFLSFLSSTAQSGQYHSSSIAAGTAIAITAFGYPTGAFLSERIRKAIGHRNALIAFSLAGTISGLFGWYLTESAYSSDTVMYIIALIVSLCNGVIIPIALTPPSSANGETANSPANNAMIFLAASSAISIISLALSNSIIANPWTSVAVSYFFGVLSIIFEMRGYNEDTRIKGYQ